MKKRRESPLGTSVDSIKDVYRSRLLGVFDRLSIDRSSFVSSAEWVARDKLQRRVTTKYDRDADRWIVTDRPFRSVPDKRTGVDRWLPVGAGRLLSMTGTEYSVWRERRYLSTAARGLMFSHGASGSAARKEADRIVKALWRETRSFPVDLLAYAENEFAAGRLTANQIEWLRVPRASSFMRRDILRELLPYLVTEEVPDTSYVLDVEPLIHETEGEAEGVPGTPYGYGPVPKKALPKPKAKAAPKTAPKAKASPSSVRSEIEAEKVKQRALRARLAKLEAVENEELKQAKIQTRLLEIQLAEAELLYKKRTGNGTMKGKGEGKGTMKGKGKGKK